MVIVGLEIVSRTGGSPWLSRRRRAPRAAAAPDVRQPSRLRWPLRIIVIAYLFLLVIWPVALVAMQTFADGLGPVLDALRQPDGDLRLQADLVDRRSGRW